MIMSDLTDSIDNLLRPGGYDHTLLTADEVSNNDFSRVTYTEDDQKRLRHFEAMAEPAKSFSKFTQLHENSLSYLLFEAKFAIQSTLAATTPMYADVSRMDRTKDVRKRGEKVVLLKRSGVSVLPETASNFMKVEVMDPSVQKYCDLYADGLANRIGLSAARMPHYLSIGILLNPLFPSRKAIVACGLMTDEQYAAARERKSFILCALVSLHPLSIGLYSLVLFVRSSKTSMADILDMKSPHSNDAESAASSGDSSDDEVICFSPSYHMADKELAAFNKLKKPKYQPTYDSSKSRALSGTSNSGKSYLIQVGPVLRRGEDLPSGHNLADYIDSNHRFNLLKFAMVHAKY